MFLPGASLVAPLATSVLYDRGGTGRSDPAGLPRTAEAVATELRDLLQAAEVPGPYIFVAHSLGGRRRNLALAASVSRGEHRALPDARHSTVTTDRADAVVQAITDLLDLT